jgi:heptosyltransferase-2
MSAETANNILICGVNWLGDACMTMPAIQCFHRQNPDTKITLLTKPGLAPLWQMHPDISNTIPLQKDTMGMLHTIREVRQHNFSKAFIFPNSWRSALIPSAAGIPYRRGRTGHYRNLLLTAPLPNDTSDRHQQWEYTSILGLTNITELPPPTLKINTEDKHNIESRITQSNNIRIGILPGAARGPSKQWPRENYIAAAKIIASDGNCQFIIMGTQSEAELCQSIAAEIGNNAISLAGQTSLPQLTAALASCKVVLCNDSGGMHLASAAGSTVIAMYGITDPTKTGPIGLNHQIIQPEGVRASRDIPRNSPEAIRALQSITPQQVADKTFSTIKNISQ